MGKLDINATRLGGCLWRKSEYRKFLGLVGYSTLHNGVLQHRWTCHDGIQHYWRTVLPIKSRQAIVDEIHNSIIISRTLGVQTLSRLRKWFYWVGMGKDVEEWCRECEVYCAKKGPMLLCNFIQLELQWKGWQ